MPKILAFDTSIDLCSVALGVDDKIIAQQKLAPQRHNELILPMIDELLRSANLKLAQLDVIAFGCGPGSFTGIRLATSIAQGLAFGANVPLAPISTLRILAQTAYDQFSFVKVLVALDARMEQIYWGKYEILDGLMEETTPDVITTPTNVVGPEDPNWVGIGNGWDVYQKELQKTCHVTEIKNHLLPEASSLIKLGIAAFKQQKTVAAQLATPIYLGSGKTWK